MITVYGASGHAKVVIDILNSNQTQITQVIDDNSLITSIMGYKVDSPEDREYKNIVIAIGNNSIRKQIVKRIKATYSKAIIHKTATIGSNVTINEGTVIMPHSVINAAVTIGKHCIINTRTIVEHDVRLSDYVHISPGAIITGGVIIGDGSQIGAGAIILPNIKIGKNVIVGAGAVVLNDIEDETVVVGNPAKVLKKNMNTNE